MRYLLLVFLLITTQIEAQNNDQKQINEIYNTALTNGSGYAWLNYLSNQIGGRLSGSLQAQKAVDYTKKFWIPWVWTAFGFSLLKFQSG